MLCYARIDWLALPNHHLLTSSYARIDWNCLKCSHMADSPRGWLPCTKLSSPLSSLGEQTICSFLIQKDWYKYVVSKYQPQQNHSSWHPRVSCRLWKGWKEFKTSFQGWTEYKTKQHFNWLKLEHNFITGVLVVGFHLISRSFSLWHLVTPSSNFLQLCSRWEKMTFKIRFALNLSSTSISKEKHNKYKA